MLAAIKPIRTDQDHREALAEIERLWSYPDDSAENDRLDVLATLVEAYEKARWPTGPVSPRDILAFAVSDMGRSRDELGALVGSRARRGPPQRASAGVSADGPEDQRRVVDPHPAPRRALPRRRHGRLTRAGDQRAAGIGGSIALSLTVRTFGCRPSTCASPWPR